MRHPFSVHDIPFALNILLIHLILHPVNECETQNGGCDETCVDTPKAFFCQCGQGYSLAADGKTCNGNCQKYNYALIKCLCLSHVRVQYRCR